MHDEIEDLVHHLEAALIKVGLGLHLILFKQLNMLLIVRSIGFRV